MEYRRIKYFLKAAETKNFTRAAAELFISHQALIKQISLLEDELGDKLFERTTRRITLTELGNEAYARFKEVDRMLEQAVADLTQQTLKNKKLLRIGIFSAIPKEQVSCIMNALMAAFPDITFEPVIGDLIDVRLDLLEGQTDVCLTNTHAQENWQNYERIPLCRMRAQIAVSLYHPWAVKSTINANDMRQEEYVKVDVSGEKHKKNREKQAHYIVPERDVFFEKIPCKRRIIVPNFESLLTVLESGKGFAVIPGDFMQRLYFKLKFFDIPGHQYMFKTEFIYPAHTDNPLMPALAEIISTIDLQ